MISNTNLLPKTHSVFGRFRGRPLDQGIQENKANKNRQMRKQKEEKKKKTRHSGQWNKNTAAYLALSLDWA
jgi:hypothetical protein